MAMPDRAAMLPGKRQLGLWNCPARVAGALPQVACVVYPVGLEFPGPVRPCQRAIREALRLEPSNATYQHELARLKLARTGVAVGGRGVRRCWPASRAL